jgi:hypothetical protein
VYLRRAPFTQQKSAEIRRIGTERKLNHKKTATIFGGLKVYVQGTDYAKNPTRRVSSTHCGCHYFGSNKHILILIAYLKRLRGMQAKAKKNTPIC